MKLFEFLDGSKVIHSSVTCALPAVRSQNVCLFRSPSAFWVILKDISLNKLLKINSAENLKDFLDCAEGGGGLCIIQPPAWCQHSCELPLLHCASLPGDSSPSPSTAWLLCSTLSRWETTFHLLCLVYLFAWFFFVCPANIFIKNPTKLSWEWWNPAVSSRDMLKPWSAFKTRKPRRATKETKCKEE